MNSTTIPSLFRSFSLDRIVDTVAGVVDYYFHDATEIGTSDVSIAVRAVFDGLDRDFTEASEIDCDMIRTAVHNEIRRIS